MDVGKVKELASGVKYYIGNPSAWEHYDDFISEKIRAIVSEIEALAEPEALAELEKPADDDAGELASWLKDAFGFGCTRLQAAVKIQQYAESYHAKKCAECSSGYWSKPPKSYPLPEAPNA